MEILFGMVLRQTTGFVESMLRTAVINGYTALGIPVIETVG